MFFFTYRITNKINGKYYLGCHTTTRVDDNYLGSGVGIQRAVKKYGKENFSLAILQFFNSREEMWEAEKSLVNESVVADSKSYNMTLGGRGGFSHIDSRGKIVSEETRKKLSQINKGRKHSPEAIEANRLRNTKENNPWWGKKRPEHSRVMKERGKNPTEQMREGYKKVSFTKSKSYKIRNNNGEEYFLQKTSLQKFAKEHNLPYVSLYASAKSNRIITKGPLKGWQVWIMGS